MQDDALIGRILAGARADVLAVLEELFAERRQLGYGPLYDLLADYPFREGKGLRPALCLAACAAAGGRPEQALHSAAALELFHNAFLVHDDVEDESEFRRGAPTLAAAHGAPVAVNVGDATNGLALDLLLRNTSTLGVRKELLVLRDVERMARVGGGAGDRARLDRRRAIRPQRPRLRPDGVQEDLLVHGGRALRHRRRVRAESHRLRRRRRADRGSRDRAGLPAAFADREHAVRRRPEGLNHTP